MVEPVGTPGAMTPSARGLLLRKPRVPAPLDPDFAPVILAKRHYLEAVGAEAATVEWALPRVDGCCGRGRLPVFPDGHADVDASVHLCGVLIQEMMWERGAARLLLCGPSQTCAALRAAYSPSGRYSFDVLTMPKICGQASTPFEVEIVSGPSALPPAKEAPQACGQDANGCRLAFDLGKSDIKTVAVKDNEVLFSRETEWDCTNPDPQYHYDTVLKALREAAAELPRVDAIGGSSTGIISASNEAMFCDIFANVPPDAYQEKVVPIFNNLAKQFDNVPLKVINDGEVTALAGAMMVKAGNLFGISLGSAEGGGYCNKDGHLLGWINEMSFVQLDLNPSAPTDFWTKHCHAGLSHMYLGQRGATRLVDRAGLDLPEDMRPAHPNMSRQQHEPHAKCLKLIQAAMEDPVQAPKARKIYETIGVWLGYALGQYAESYEIDHVVILGRVSSGSGGQVILDSAQEVLKTEFPELAHVRFHTPDERFKRVGQCIAAAALPPLA